MNSQDRQDDLTPAHHATSGSLARYIAPIVLVAVVYLLHGNALGGFWRFDDPQIIDFVLHHSLAEAFYRPEVWQSLKAPFFTPLLTLSYGVDAATFGLQPSGFFLHQLATLFLAAWITYYLLRRWIPPHWACLGGILFLSGFPVTVVAQQIMTRHYVEGLIFAAAALICFYESPGRRWLAWLGALCYLIAMLAKEVYAPLVVFLFVARHQIAISRNNTLPHVTPYVFAAALYAPWRHTMLGGMGGYTTRLIPTPDELGHFFKELVSWGIGDGPWGIGLATIATGLLIQGIRRRVLRPAQLATAAALLFAPLLPVMITVAQPDAAGYFIPHRYLFLPWWCLSCTLVIVLARLEHGTAATRGAKYAKPVALMVYGVVLAGVTLQHQLNPASCFQQLIVENERMYKTGWEDDNTALIQVPPVLLAYTKTMTAYIAAIRHLPAAQMPHIQGIGDSPLPASKTFVWSYDPNHCGPRAPR